MENHSKANKKPHKNFLKPNKMIIGLLKEFFITFDRKCFRMNKIPENLKNKVVINI